jgi:hypothetical protein
MSVFADHLPRQVALRPPRGSGASAMATVDTPELPPDKRQEPDIVMGQPTL